MSTRPSGPCLRESQSQTVPLASGLDLNTTMTVLNHDRERQPRLAGHTAVSAALRQGLNRSTWQHRGERRSKNRDRMRRGAASEG